MAPAPDDVENEVEDTDESENESEDETEDESEDESESEPFADVEKESTPMDDATRQSVVGAMVKDAILYTDTELSPERAEATDRYFGRPYGNEVKGRSQAISTDVRDTVQAILPDLMRVFFGSERMVEYLPHGPEDVANAAQATDFINNVVLQQDNRGFIELYSAFKDALVRRIGIVKWWWEDENVTESYRLSNISEDQLAAMESQPDISYRIIEQESTLVAGPQGSVAQTSYTCDVTRTEKNGRARIAALPPEEFIFSRSARNLRDALMVGHRTLKRRGELLAMGIDEDFLSEHIGQPSTGAWVSGGGNELESNPERIAREVSGETVTMEDVTGDPSLEEIEYIEAYCYLDEDGDGIPELRRVICIGPGYTVYDSEPWSERPFAVFLTDPEPHTMLGLSIADFTADVQKIKTAVLRGILDSLSFALFPTTVVLDGKVNMGDAMGQEVGRVVREYVPGAIREFAHSFLGQQAFPVLAYMDEIKESRTGMSRGAMGIDPDSLQSSTKAAVAATVTAAQQRKDLLARVFAETGFTELMRGLLRLYVQHQPRARIVRLRGEYVEINPAVWSAEMDVTINVGLGTGLTSERMAQLSSIAQKQEQLLQLLGPENPLVSLPQYRETLAKMIELTGYKDASAFFKPLPPNWQPPSPPPPKPSAEELLAQVQMKQIESEIVTAQSKLALEHEKMVREDDRERDKNEAEMFLKAYEIEARYNVEVDKQELAAIVNKQRETPMRGG